MIAQKTEFQFDEFVIVQSSMNFLQPKEEQEGVDIHVITENYVIELDYGFRRDRDITYLFIKVSINKTKDPLLGYQIFCEGVGVLDANLIKNLKEFENKRWGLNAIAFGINQLRGYILAMTSYGPIGKYRLPLINLKELVKARLESRAKSSQEKKKTAKKGLSEKDFNDLI